MPTEQTTWEINGTHEVKTVSTSEQRLGALMLLVFLILVVIGGMAVLCYKLNNPTVTLTIKDR
jgi:hypothetical protein